MSSAAPVAMTPMVIPEDAIGRPRRVVVGRRHIVRRWANDHRRRGNHGRRDNDGRRRDRGKPRLMPIPEWAYTAGAVSRTLAGEIASATSRTFGSRLTVAGITTSLPDCAAHTASIVKLSASANAARGPLWRSAAMACFGTKCDGAASAA